MKTIYKLLVFAVIGSIGFAACTEDYTNEIDKKFAGDKVVVEAYITTDDTNHYVQLTKLKSYFDASISPRISGATVKIERQETGEVDVLTEVVGMPGVYATPKKAYASGLNEYYKLMVTNTGVKGDDGVDYYEATCQLRPSIKLDSIYTDINPNFYVDDDTTKEVDEDELEDWGYKRYWEDGQPVHAIRLNAQEPAGYGDYYRWIFYRNGVLETDTLNEMIFESDEFVDGNYFADWEIWDIGVNDGDVITVETNTITEDFFIYMLDVMLETEWGAGPFGGPPANPKTNISNGGLGFFAAYSTSRLTTVVSAN